MRFLVTGGAGFLGKHVVKKLEHCGNNVVVLDNIDSRCGGDYSVMRAHCDVRDFRLLEHIIVAGNFTHIIHLAAYGRNLTCRDFPADAFQVNVEGTANILEAAALHRDIVERVVVCSSNIVLSDQDTNYKKTKLAVEAHVRRYALLGVSCMALRPSNIYGSGQSRKEHQLCAFAGLDESYRKRGYFEISGDGTQTRDWVYVRDVARAFVLASHAKVTGETFDVCTGRQTSMNAIAKMLDVKIKYTPARPGDAKALISDPKPAWKNLSFLANIRLQDGIWDAFPSIRLPSAEDLDVVAKEKEL